MLEGLAITLVLSGFALIVFIGTKSINRVKNKRARRNNV